MDMQYPRRRYSNLQVTATPSGSGTQADTPLGSAEALPRRVEVYHSGRIIMVGIRQDVSSQHNRGSKGGGGVSWTT